MKISRKKLLSALNTVRPGLASKEEIVQSTCFVFGDNKVYTYNDEIAVSTPLKLDITGAVSARELLSLLTKIKDEEVDLEFVDEELRITAGRTTAGIRFQEEVHLSLEELGEPDEWEALPDSFTTTLEHCMFSVGKDASKPILTVIHVTSEYAEATDDYRVTRAQFEDDIDIEPFLLPGAAVGYLKNYDVKEIAFTPGWVHFKCGKHTTFSCRVLEGEYLDIEQYLDLPDESVQLPPELIEALDKATIFTAAQGKAEETVSISLTRKKVTCRGEGDTGWLEESASVKYTGSSLSFEAYPHMLKKALEVNSKVHIGDGRLVLLGDGWLHVVCVDIKED